MNTMNTLPAPVSDLTYMVEQVEKIVLDYEESGSKEALDEFAMHWVEAHAEEYDRTHPRISKLETELEQMPELTDEEFLELDAFLRDAFLLATAC
jgi:hypothetical protein